jgi:hypothetical protein
VAAHKTPPGQLAQDTFAAAALAYMQHKGGKAYFPQVEETI